MRGFSPATKVLGVADAGLASMDPSRPNAAAQMHVAHTAAPLTRAQHAAQDSPGEPPQAMPQAMLHFAPEAMASSEAPPTVLDLAGAPHDAGPGPAAETTLIAQPAGAAAPPGGDPGLAAACPGPCPEAEAGQEQPHGQQAGHGPDGGRHEADPQRAGSSPSQEPETTSVAARADSSLSNRVLQG